MILMLPFILVISLYLISQGEPSRLFPSSRHVLICVCVFLTCWHNTESQAASRPPRPGAGHSPQSSGPFQWGQMWEQGSGLGVPTAASGAARQMLPGLSLHLHPYHPAGPAALRGVRPTMSLWPWPPRPPWDRLPNFAGASTAVQVTSSHGCPPHSSQAATPTPDHPSPVAAVHLRASLASPHLEALA